MYIEVQYCGTTGILGLIPRGFEDVSTPVRRD